MLGKESLLEKLVLKMLVLEKRPDDQRDTADQNQEPHYYVQTAGGTGLCPHGTVLHGIVTAHQRKKQDSFIDTQVFTETA